MANRQGNAEASSTSASADGEMDDRDGEAGSQPLFDDIDYDVYGIQPGQLCSSQNHSHNDSNSQPDATSTISVTMSPPDSCGRVQLTLYTYPELHQFVVEMVKIFEDIYNIRRHH